MHNVLLTRLHRRQVKEIGCVCVCVVQIPPLYDNSQRSINGSRQPVIVSEWVLTVNSDCGRVAEPQVGNVLGHAGVVATVGEASSHDDQVAFPGHQVVAVDVRVDGASVELPVGLGRRASARRMATHLHLASSGHLLRIGWNLEVTLQN